MNNINYDLSCYYSIGQQSHSEAVLRFRAEYSSNHNRNCYSTRRTLSVHDSFEHILQIAVAALKHAGVDDPQINVYECNLADVHGDKVFVSIEDNNYQNTDTLTKYDRSLTINCYGDHDAIHKASSYLSQNIEERKVPTVRWEFITSDGRRSQDISIERAKPIRPEFYPWIGDVYGYFDRYIASESSILVLLGETGTAKTSFIRSLIWHSSLNTMFTYEEELLKSDALFVDFIVGKENDLLVVEDADLFLTSREHDGNKIMSKFLNVSDGLASIGKKKMIFTANLTEIAKIDNALLRAGRCFDCQMFRRLSYAEACAAAKVAGIPAPAKDGRYTLAELFAMAKGESHSAQRNKVGF